MFETIVVGFDGSEISERGLRLACDLAGKYGSDVHLVHTPEPQTVAFAMGAVAGYHTAVMMPSAAEVQAANEKIVSQASEIAGETGHSIAHIHVSRGDPGEEIVAYAQKCGADLIVTGRRGLGAIGALVQGSTSLRVNHLAKCACLSVV